METKLIAVTHEQMQLDFFRDRLKAAKRRLDWSMRHKSDWNDHAEKGAVVSYYVWAVEQAEKAAKSQEVE